MKIREALEKAVELIEQDGWQRGFNGTCDGPKCAMGAISQAATGDPKSVQWGIDNFLNARLHEIGEASCIEGYNDHHDRKKEEVIEFLRQCAKHPDAEKEFVVYSYFVRTGDIR